MRSSICKTPHACVQCKQQFYPKRTDRLTFCSRACGHAHQRDAAAKRLDMVAHTRAAAQAKARADAERRRALKAAAPKPVFHHTCDQCALPFTSPDPRRRRFCSPACCKKTTRKARYDRQGSDTHRKKARRHGVEYVRVNPITIFERDGWRCQLCGRPTPKKLRGTYDPRAPELDHILPLALKGPHTPINLQCSCRRCNGAKGAQWIGQGLLFG